MDPAASHVLHSMGQQDRDICGGGACQDKEQRAAILELERNIHEKSQHGWRRVVLHFTPSWFSINMGTGITAILLHTIPYNARWLYWLSVAIFALNVCLFVLFIFITALRYLLYRNLFAFMIRHPVQSLFIGTLPMGLATIINMIVYVCVPAWGAHFITLAWALWWIDAIIAVMACFYLPFVIINKHEAKLSKITAAWVLPIVSTVVASATGGIVAEVLPNKQHQLWTIIASYVLWGTGFPLAMVVLVMYFHRLTIYHLPPREVIVSVFLPLGPIGQGGFALMQLGRVAKSNFPATGTFDPDSGAFFYNLGNYVALILWGYGLVWLFFAVASITRSRFPFNMGWWGFTFPLGTYALSTTTIGHNLSSPFFKILGTILSVTVVLLWLLVSLKTLIRVIQGKLFHAPCVQAYEKELATAHIRNATSAPAIPMNTSIV